VKLFENEASTNDTASPPSTHGNTHTAAPTTSTPQKTAAATVTIAPTTSVQ
jgi:hypothetical protein